MGLLKAGGEALGRTFADQWLEFVAIEDMQTKVLAKREYPRSNGSNTKGTPGVLTNGTRITVPEGMAMMIVDQGKVTEFTAEPGEFVYDSGTEPSVFYGGLGKGIVNSFKKFTDNFKFGGEPPKDQRVYYINIREIMGLKFGTGEPILFPDPRYDITLYLRFYGTYSIKITDPIVFVSNIMGSAIQDMITIDIFEENGQNKEEFLTSLTSALSNLAHEENISFNELPRFQKQLAKLMNNELDEDWVQNRGIEIISVAIPSVSLTEESKEDVRKYDEIHIASKNGKGVMTQATAEAMKDAAKNEGGMAGTFMGMNVGNMVGNNVGNFANAIFTEQEKEEATIETKWECPKCYKENTGKFCAECGEKKPESSFCINCGAKVDKEAKFCPECGNKVQ